MECDGGSRGVPNMDEYVASARAHWGNRFTRNGVPTADSTASWAGSSAGATGAARGRTRHACARSWERGARTEPAVVRPARA